MVFTTILHKDGEVDRKVLANEILNQLLVDRMVSKYEYYDLIKRFLPNE